MVHCAITSGLLALVGIELLLVGCASAPSPEGTRTVDRTIIERAQAADGLRPGNGKPSVAAVDRGVLDRTFYSTCSEALLKCGYSKDEANAVAKEYVGNSAAWNAEIDKLRYQGVAPLHLLPELALWEAVRGRCQAAQTNSLTYSNVASLLRGRSRPQDRVLVNNILATTALRGANYAEAKVLLDDTLHCLGGVSANDPSARKARQLFYKEDKKNFRGEPFERVMAYYYRGILYWMDGDPENARACFRSGQIEDSDSENKEYSNDYILLDYLDGMITARLGDDGTEAFRRATNAAGPNVVKLLQPPPYRLDANVQIFLEFGKGPTKRAEGNFKEMLKIKPSPVGPVQAVVKLGDQVIQVAPYDDLAYQATTRGGRVMDHILKNKVVFKNVSKDVGVALMAAGVAVASQRDGGPAGAVLLILGGAAYGLSALTNPACDTRTWWNLPQYLAFVSLPLPSGNYQGALQFLDRKGKSINCLEKSFSFEVSDQRKNTVLFLSDKDI